jgi:hypothetical protein
MFLPVLLVRDFGIAGFLVFAIPNILGAAAMAWLLPDADASRRFVEKHARLCASFSVVTIAFHVFFVIWMIQRQIMVPAAVPVILALAVAMLVTVASNRGAVVAAWAVLTVSLAAFAAAAIHLPSAVAALHFTGPVPPINLLGLAAVCVFGFSLCPYLDLTFHRARQNTSRSQGKIAFAGGFGGVFAAMILFTLWYAPLLNQPIRSVDPFVIRLISLHMSAQIAFTLAAHLRSLAANWSPAIRRGIRDVIIPASVVLLGANFGETAYRISLAWYGLVFPAALWIGVGTLRRLCVFALACAIAAPMYWLGFIDDRMLWLLPGVAIVLLARLL